MEPANVPNSTYEVTGALLWGTFFNRVLIGIIVGLMGHINLPVAVRGGMLGVLISIDILIYPLFEGSLQGGVILLIAGLVYGVIADLLAIKLFR